MSATSYATALNAFTQRLNTWDGAEQGASRRRILEAFLELAISSGFTSVSMRSIASAVNIKPPSLYSHFPHGRDEIMAESLRWHFHRFGVALIEAVSRAESADEFWDSMVRLHFTRQVQVPESNLWDLIVATDRMAGVLPGDLRAQVNDWVALYENMYMAAAHDMGYLNASDRVRIVMTLLEGATRWAPGNYNDNELETLAHKAVALSRRVLELNF